MPDRTVNQIIDAAYRKCGVQAPTSVQDGYALAEFQDMLDAWSIEGLIVPYYTTENFTLTIGQAIYSIGTTADGADLETATGRPVRIKRAWIRESNYDYPVIEMTEKDYARITKKDETLRPKRFWYDPQYPNGSIKFDVEASKAYAFHIISEKPLAAVTAITDTLSLPLGMNRTLVYNLALGLSAELDVEVSKETTAIAVETKNALEQVNLKARRNQSQVDSALTAISSRGSRQVRFS